MVINHIALLRNIGQFDSVDNGRNNPFGKLSLVYAENGRGKTTLAAIFRSLSADDPSFIMERRRIGSALGPHVVISSDFSNLVYKDNAWTAPLPNVAVFDDAFVAANVCSGIEIETEHCKNLHELILGQRGANISMELQAHVAAIEEHNRALRAKSDAIPAAVRGDIAVDEFCELAFDPDLESKIQQTERALAAARAADAIRLRAPFKTFVMPDFDLGAIGELLAKNLPALEGEAADRVQAHLQNLGAGGESWVSDGLARVASAFNGHDHEVCPFCAQDIRMSPVIRHYQAYFSEGYRQLQADTARMVQEIEAKHRGEAQAAFERWVRDIAEAREFWGNFTDVPDVKLDTAVISRSWILARDRLESILQAKLAAPLSSTELSEESMAAVAAYNEHRRTIADIVAALETVNRAISIVKEQVVEANAATLAGDLKRLMYIRARYRPDIAALSDDYLKEKAAKRRTEELRKQKRDELDRHRDHIFPTYGAAINDYLHRFNAGFRLEKLAPVNNRGGSSASYNVLINDVPIALVADAGPCFRNTLSAGDRNTLALAFFFASLRQDQKLGEKIVVIDDPMTSLDEHRSLVTVQEMLRLSKQVAQMIVCSHSRPFLCAIWKDADKNNRAAMRIIRSGDGSTLESWDVRQDCITEHDRRHALVSEYLRAGNPATEREVAVALRPILESFVRVAYPSAFPPDSMLGNFIGKCRERQGQPEQILDENDTDELRALLDYANRFHHDTNQAWETELINDQELASFAQRTLEFSRRPARQARLAG